MSSSTLLLLLRLGLSLGLVFGLMWVAVRVLRGRPGLLGRGAADQLEVLERKPLTKNASIAIVRVADQTLAIGVTEHSVTLLTSAPVGADLAAELGSLQQRVGPVESQVTDLDATDLDVTDLEVVDLGAVTVRPSRSPGAARRRAKPAVEPVAAEPVSAEPVPVESSASGRGSRSFLDTLRDMTVRHEVGVQR